MDIPQKVIDICKMLEDKKAEDIIVCDTTKMHNVADYFVIATGGSSMHLNGICDYLEEKASEYDLPTPKREGFILSTWVVLDFDNILVHLFTKEEREKYSLQKLLNDGKNEYSLKRINFLLDSERKRQMSLEKREKVAENKKTRKVPKTKSNLLAKDRPVATQDQEEPNLIIDENFVEKNAILANDGNIEEQQKNIGGTKNAIKRAKK